MLTPYALAHLIAPWAGIPLHQAMRLATLVLRFDDPGPHLMDMHRAHYHRDPAYADACQRLATLLYPGPNEDHTPNV